MDIGDCAGCQVDVEAQQVKVLDRFKFNGVTKEILANECLDSWVGKKMFVAGDETHVAVVVEMEVRVVEKVVAQLVPSMFNESDGNVAKGR